MSANRDNYCYLTGDRVLAWTGKESARGIPLTEKNRGDNQYTVQTCRSPLTAKVC